MRPELSIIICTYNRKVALERLSKQLFEQFKSLLIYSDNPQALVADIELLILDSNSTDGTNDLVFEILAKKKNNYLEVNYIKELHHDFSITRNRAIKEARGNTLVFLDDDLRLANNWLETVYNIALNSTSSVVYGARVVPDWASTLPIWLEFESDSAIDQRVFAIHDYNSSAKDYPFAYGGVEVTSPNSSCFICKRDLFLNYGNFKEDLLIYGEKRRVAEAMEFFHRILTLGASVQYAPELVVYRSMPAKLMNPETVLKHYEQWAELIYYLQKNDLYHIPNQVKIEPKYKLESKLVFYKAQRLLFDLLINPERIFSADLEIAKLKGKLVQVEHRNHFV